MYKKSSINTFQQLRNLKLPSSSYISSIARTRTILANSESDEVTVSCSRTIFSSRKVTTLILFTSVVEMIQPLRVKASAEEALILLNNGYPVSQISDSLTWTLLVVFLLSVGWVIPKIESNW